jgi:hypothetical protein
MTQVTGRVVPVRLLDRAYMGTGEIVLGCWFGCAWRLLCCGALPVVASCVPSLLGNLNCALNGRVWIGLGAGLSWAMPGMGL